MISEQYYAVLNSLDNGQPFTNLVAYAISSDFKFLLFATNKRAEKYTRIKKNANVSLLIDNRTNQPEDVSCAVAITVFGTAAEETINRHLKSLFIDRHPRLKEFIGQPTTALIQVRIVDYVIAHFDRTHHFLPEELRTITFVEE